MVLRDTEDIRLCARNNPALSDALLALQRENAESGRGTGADVTDSKQRKRLRQTVDEVSTFSFILRCLIIVMICSPCIYVLAQSRLTRKVSLHRFNVRTVKILQSDDEAEAEELLQSDFHPDAS